jgi:hypothetical protein
MYIKNIIVQVLLFAVLVISQRIAVFGQFYFEGNPLQDRKVQVNDESKKVFQYPWAGGMNSCQFGEVDMNMDGIKDLFAFDRQGDRIMTFINGGTQNTVDYEYAPQYISSFPELYDWAILIDYNMDGKEDIFTYAHILPGIIVYKNVSNTELEFELEVYPYLESFQGGGYTNILVTDVDYPGISDIDNDGDLDILTFWGLGAFVEMHKNLSMEKYGIPDSLDYIKTTFCWGYFAENDESNIIYLDTCMGGKNCTLKNTKNEKIRNTRHTGSTFLLLDLDGDDDKDLVLGDVDYPILIELINGGTVDSAHIISQDTLFPSYNKPVNLFSMPVAAYIDVDNNGINDLIVSAFDPGLETSRNKRSVKLYSNSGANNYPYFEYEMDNFLQEDMIDVGSGAYPVFEDYDGDGLPDLFISNFGYYIYSYYSPGMFLHSVYWSNIALFKNTGSVNNPAFTRITHDFANLHDYHLTGIFLTFGDVDGDMDKDMIIGMQNGTLWYFENIADQNLIWDFADPVQNYQGIDVGDFSAPQLFDLNGDDLPDLIVGEEDGNLNYYENTGSSVDPVFTFITDSLGKVNVTDLQFSYTGYSTPFFFKNMENETNLVVGSENGKVFYYKNIDGNLQGTFEENDSLYVLINDEPFELMSGIRTGATMEDLDNDGYFDLVVGNYSGGLNYYYGIEIPPVSGINEKHYNLVDCELYPNPAKDRIFIDFKNASEFNHVHINVYNLMSTKVFTDDFYNTLDISLSVDHLPDGIYICEIIVETDFKVRLYKRMIISR